MLIPEDIHWADEVSLHPLGSFTCHVISHPLLELGTCRNDELTGELPLYLATPLLLRGLRADRLDPHRLDDVVQQADFDFAIASA